MFARLVAILICLWVADPRLGRAEPAGSPVRELVVYLKTSISQSAEPVEEMAHEAEAIMSSAGYTIEWRDLGRSGHDAGDAFLVVIELKGVCEAPEPGAGLAPLMAGTSLASTAVADGKVLPYSQLECGNLSKLIGPSIASEPTRKREFLYGRAMGRLVAHELFHVLIGTRDHDDGGVAKRAFSAKDILADHFEFEVTSLDQLRDSGAGGAGSEVLTIDGNPRAR